MNLRPDPRQARKLHHTPIVSVLDDTLAYQIADAFLSDGLRTEVVRAATRMAYDLQVLCECRRINGCKPRAFGVRKIDDGDFA